jgi:hypothetical protein
LVSDRVRGGHCDLVCDRVRGGDCD